MASAAVVWTGPTARTPATSEVFREKAALTRMGVLVRSDSIANLTPVGREAMVAYGVTDGDRPAHRRRAAAERPTRARTTPDRPTTTCR